MSDHARLSPSRAHRYIACPGSIREEEKYPETSSNAAVDGTHTHYILELCIRAGLVDPLTCVGKFFQNSSGGFECDEARAKRVAVAIDYIKSRDAELVDAEVIAEERVSPHALLGRDDMSGTCDVQIHAKGVLEIVDYKDGMLHVSVKENPQLELYAISVLSMMAVEERPEMVRMTIVQPKLAEMGLEPISWVEVETQYLLDRVSYYVQAAAATDDPEASLSPGEDQCRYCRAKGSCRALSAGVLEMFGVVDPFAVTVDIAQELVNKKPNDMTGAELCKVIEAAPLMRQMLDSVEEEALKRIKAGQTIPGLKVVNGRGSQVWALAEDQIVEKLKTMGVPMTEIRQSKVISPAQTKKLQWIKRTRGSETKMQLSARQLKVLDNEYITKLAGKHTVVPESDSRDAVVFDASPMFGVVDLAPVLPDWLK